MGEGLRARAEQRGRARSRDALALPGTMAEGTPETRAEEGRTSVRASPDPNGLPGVLLLRVWGRKMNEESSVLSRGGDTSR